MEDKYKKLEQIKKYYGLSADDCAFLDGIMEELAGNYVDEEDEQYNNR